MALGKIVVSSTDNGSEYFSAVPENSGVLTIPHLGQLLTVKSGCSVPAMGLGAATAAVAHGRVYRKALSLVALMAAWVMLSTLRGRKWIGLSSEPNVLGCR